MKKSKYSDAQIMSILKQAEGGVPVADLCREHGMSGASFYKWRSKYGGMDASLMARMTELDEENKRLKKMYAEKSRQNDFLKEALGKSGEAVHCPAGHCPAMSREGQGREMAEWAVRYRSVGIALACRTFSISETCYRYQLELSDENELIADWLVALTNAKKTWGFGLCFLHLRNVKGVKWNHKRIYRELELNMRIKPRKRLQREKLEPLAVPEAPNEAWSMHCPAAHAQHVRKGLHGRPVGRRSFVQDIERAG